MTVSRALRTPEQVSDKLREKIEAAVSELGYLPNPAASSLASASSYTIAMVVPSLSESGCAEMFAGLQKVLQPAGYHIMLAESQHHLEREEKLLETLLSYNGGGGAAQRRAFAKRPQRAHRRQHSGGGDRRRARRSDRHEHRHRLRGGHVSADANGYRQRLPEHRAAVRQSGTVDLPAAPAGLAQGAAAQPYVAASGDQRRAARQLQHRRAAAAGIPAGPPELDALVCASDELAGGALYECQRRRIKVPDNLAVVGFGNSEFSRVCQPPLTTMTIPHRDIGIQAGRRCWRA